MSAQMVLERMFHLLGLVNQVVAVSLMPLGGKGPRGGVKVTTGYFMKTKGYID